MKRALPLLAAGLLALACQPSPPEEPAPTPPAGGSARRDGSAVERIARAVLDPAGTLAQDPHKQAQKQTVSDIRNTGTAMFSWLTDQVGAAAAGQSQTKGVEIAAYRPISHAELTELLVPQYISAVPQNDGWGHPFEFYLNTEDVLAREVMSIRSPGRDGTFEADVYTVTSFEPGDFDRDIVWSDGFFVRWPQAPPPR